MDTKLPTRRFKQRCLALIDLVEQTQATIVITRDGVPVAQLAPIREAPSPDAVLRVERDDLAEPDADPESALE